MKKIEASTANIYGRAGEHLVCADFLLNNIPCFIVEGKSHYDMIADVSGMLLKIQVKATSQYRSRSQIKNLTPVYFFQARKYGKGARLSYQKGDADIIAYVALDSKKIAYFQADIVQQCVSFKIKKFKNKYTSKAGMFIEDYPIDKILKNYKKIVDTNESTS